MPNGIVRFGDFQLDRGRYELRHADNPLKLEKIPMDLLLLLVEADGQLVTRDQIIERIWGRNVFLDTEHGINTAVRKIRQTLKDDPDQPRFVQTVTGKGYRFIAPVTVEPQTPANGNGTSGGTLDHHVPPASLVSQPATATSPRASVANAARLTTVAIAGAAIVAAALLAFNVRGWRDHLWPHPARPTIQSLAVLPLENLSGDPSQDYFADGMTDELITMLAKNTSLRVISRTSVMQYKKAHRPLRDIARELGVDGILEGSVERSGTRVHLNAQLLHAESDTHLWAETYDRDLYNVGSLQSELAQTVARQVGATLLTPPGAKRQLNPEAHDAYLIGRYFWFAGNYKKSRESFQKAIGLDPGYAAAWGGLADSYVADGVIATRAFREQNMAPAEEAALRAVALDDSLAEAHQSLAAYYFFYRWDWDRAERESARAVELNPGLAEPHHLRSYILEVLNRTNEAIEQEKISMGLDPFARPWGLTRALIHARRFDAALEEARLRADGQPRDPAVHGYLSDAYWYKGMENEAAKEMETTFMLSGDRQSAIQIHKAFATGGFKADLEWQLNDLRRKQKSGDKDASPIAFASAFAALKRKDETLYWLEQAYEEREPWLAHIQYLPYLDFVHDDPRYQAIVKKMGFQPADEAHPVLQSHARPN